MSVLPPLHHLGYVVEDLEAGVEEFAARHGAGPFFAIEHLQFDEVTFLDEDATYDHSSAFGQWGPIMVELTQVHDARPQGLRDALVAPGGGVGHIAWLADSLEAESARLQAGGMRPFHSGRSGPVRAVWFDGDALFGHPVEVLERCPEVLGFHAAIAAAAADWDGRRPLRSAAEVLGGEAPAG